MSVAHISRKQQNSFNYRPLAPKHVLSHLAMLGTPLYPNLNPLILSSPRSEKPQVSTAATPGGTGIRGERTSEHKTANSGTFTTQSNRLRCWRRYFRGEALAPAPLKGGAVSPALWFCSYLHGHSYPPSRCHSR